MQVLWDVGKPIARHNLNIDLYYLWYSHMNIMETHSWKGTKECSSATAINIAQTLLTCIWSSFETFPSLHDPKWTSWQPSLQEKAYLSPLPLNTNLDHIRITVKDSRIKQAFLPILIIELLPTSIGQLLSQQLGSKEGLVKLTLEWRILIKLKNCITKCLPLSSK